MKGAQEIEPDGVRQNPEGKFGNGLAMVRSAMQRVARSFKPRELADIAFRLYEQFRPAIPEGVKGWGARGDLDLGHFQRLAKEKS